MKNKTYPGTIAILFFFFFLSDCRHARVILPPPLPAICKNATNPRQIINCDSEKIRQKTNIEANKNKRQIKTFTHKFLFWGLKPKRIEYNMTDICPNGAYEIHEFSTWKDGLMAEVTLGILMPRTITVTCY